jgi:hypothetical protein
MNRIQEIKKELIEKYNASWEYEIGFTQEMKDMVDYCKEIFKEQLEMLMLLCEEKGNIHTLTKGEF